MSEDVQFLLPDVGEGLTDAEIVTWRVAVGDVIQVNDVLVEIETAKSVVELPSPTAGTVADLLVPHGETVPVGTPLVLIRTADKDGIFDAARQRSIPAAEPEPDALGDVGPPVLVGYGPAHGATRRRRRRSAVERADPGVQAPIPDVATRAKPPVRKLAADLGVDLTKVVATGPNGLVTREDVVAHAARPAPAVATSDSDGAVTRVPVRGVRKATAAAMVHSAFSAPHVTEFLTVDVTRSLKLVRRLRKHPALDGAHVTLLLLVAQAVVLATREFPEINASWDEAANEIVLHHTVNLGIATATPRGLLVPTVKNAGSLTLPQLAKTLTGIVETTRGGRATPSDLSGGTITITNVGVFGIDAATPLLNPGEAAILCLGALRRLPWEHRGRVRLRWVVQLALSFDHRLVDGELGGKVLTRIGAVLRHPERELVAV